MIDHRVEDKLLTAIRELNFSSTVSELIAKTGLPRSTIEETLPVIVQERRGHYQVKESGEIVYSFPKGLSNTVTGFRARFQRFLRQAVHFLVQALIFLFKIWIVVMLVGYFIVFVAIATLFLLAVLAASFTSKDNQRSRNSSRDGSFVFSLFLDILNFIIRIWFYSQLLGTTNKQNITKQKTSPFHQAVFKFEFGTEDVVRTWEKEARERLINFIKANNGIITLDEIQLFLGINREEANKFFSYLLLNYKGDVKVSDAGAIYGWFPEILRTIRTEKSETYPPPIPPQPFSGNPPGIQPWIITFNLVNIVFGLMFTTFYFDPLGDSFLTFIPYIFNSFLAQIIDQNLSFSVSTIGLGFVPLIFSALFFLVPFLRWIGLKAYNSKIRSRNQSMELLRSIFKSPQRFEIKSDWEKRVIMDFAEQRKLDVVSGPKGYVYSLPQLREESQSVQRLRTTINPKEYQLGQTIFDSSN